MTQAVNLEIYLEKGGNCYNAVNNFSVINTFIYRGRFEKEAIANQLNINKGDKLSLKSEEEDNVGCFSVSVWYKDKKLGFLHKDLAPVISRLVNYICVVKDSIDKVDIEGKHILPGLPITLVNKKALYI